MYVYIYILNESSVFHHALLAHRTWPVSNMAHTSEVRISSKLFLLC